MGSQTAAVGNVGAAIIALAASVCEPTLLFVTERGFNLDLFSLQCQHLIKRPFNQSLVSNSHQKRPRNLDSIPLIYVRNEKKEETN